VEKKGNREGAFQLISRLEGGSCSVEKGGTGREKRENQRGGRSSFGKWGFVRSVAMVGEAGKENEGIKVASLEKKGKQFPNISGTTSGLR